LLAAATVTTTSLLAAGAVALEADLKSEPAESLSAAARKDGDAARGAILFHQPHTTCTKCHAVDGTSNGLGPDLTALPRETTDAQLVESLLQPSKFIRKGFELMTMATSDGRTITGLVVESNDQRIVLRDPAQPAQTITIARGDIVQQSAGNISAMPAGLVNQLSSRQQFLDLVRYLIELRDGGRAAATALAPPPALVALQIPEYESHIDHAGLLHGLNDAAFTRGKAIYDRLCANCHGTHDQPGSLPNSLRFASGKFKNGSDPYAMYQTLTRGFGLMAPQSWMVPQQKYDVIHYIREAYLKPSNPTQFVALSTDYLANLPKGDTRGPPPRTIEPWVTMDYGPSLIHTYELGAGGGNIAQKGIAVRLDAGAGGISRGRAWTIFEHDTLRWAGAWMGSGGVGSGFIDWNGIQFNGKHQVHPHIVGDVCFQNPTGPGWADPATGSLADDQRVVGRDGRKYGPLPRAWGRFRGLYHHGDHVVVSYTVGSTEVLESPGVVLRENALPPVFTRTLHVGPREQDLLTVIASRPDQPAGILAPSSGCNLTTIDDHLCLNIPDGDRPLQLVLWTTSELADQSREPVESAIRSAKLDRDLTELTRGGPPRWPQKLTTNVALGKSDGPFAIDVLTHREQNPWLAQMRFTGLDFLPGGDRIVACTWDGDVWLVSGLSMLDNPFPPALGINPSPALTWQRIASGLFQPLGIKLHDGKIFVTCRDQLVILRDLNGDGETDFYECFNSDHQVTEHFHEFAMGLQTDAQGNFYYAKSARHALPAVVPHHGTLLRVAPDGSKTEILATGFRAANGVCLNDDGTFVVTDQEGHWNPKNRINWVTPGKFYGNMFGYHDVNDSSDAAMEQPLCWITNKFDRSPGELLWVPRGGWGPLAGSLLNLSYGAGKFFVVPFEDVGGHKQGGMCQLPIAPLPTGVMRGRFSPLDRQLYACGMFAWAGNATQPGGLYRIRYTGRPMWLPVGLRARKGSIELTFTDALDKAAASNPANYSLKTWSLKRTENYGSDHYDEQPLAVESAQVSDDGRVINLQTPTIQPTWGMEIACRLLGADGTPVERVIHNSIFHVAD
jgi:putative heme-binding domain-containing protein